MKDSCTQKKVVKMSDRFLMPASDDLLGEAAEVDGTNFVDDEIGQE